ncbi:hypothetical protein Q9966_002781 [Columba livia]|nr:hypothetical protein Q9966_002781 [Columba livia]
MKGYYGRPVDVRDPFEKERCREWERNYREWYGKVYKGCAVAAQPPPAVNRENFSPERFGPPGSRQENSACAWGNREDYPGGQSHRSHNITGHDGEEPSGREGPGISDPRKSKEKEVKYPWGHDKGNEEKRHQKRRKCNENEGFCSAELLEGARTAREPVPAGDDKTDSLFVLPSRGDATPVRDEPMEADWIAFKPGSGEERTEKDEPKEKNDQTKSKVEVAAPPKKDDTIIAAQTSQETVDTDCENSPQMEPPVKKVKKELSKMNDAVISSSQKDEKAPGAPWKYHPKVTKGHPGTRTAKDEKVKKDHPKETKSEKPSREDKSEKPAEKSKTSDAKPEKGKGNADEKVDEEHEATCTDASKPETAEWKPSAKGKSEPDAGKGERTPETAKCAFLNRPAKEIELQQETGENLVRGENVPPAEDPAGKPKASSGYGAGGAYRAAQLDPGYEPWGRPRPVPVGSSYLTSQLEPVREPLEDPTEMDYETEQKTFPRGSSHSVPASDEETETMAATGTPGAGAGTKAEAAALEGLREHYIPVTAAVLAVPLFAVVAACIVISRLRKRAPRSQGDEAAAEQVDAASAWKGEDQTKDQGQAESGEETQKGETAQESELFCNSSSPSPWIFAAELAQLYRNMSADASALPVPSCSLPRGASSPDTWISLDSLEPQPFWCPCYQYQKGHCSSDDDFVE